jgi:hypothetical protein
MKAGAKTVTVRVGDAKVDIALVPDDEPVAQDANEWAIDDAHKA